MSEQLKQELEADTDRLEAETVAGSETTVSYTHLTLPTIA